MTEPTLPDLVAQVAQTAQAAPQAAQVAPIAPRTATGSAAPVAMPDLVPSLKFSPTLQRIRAQRQAELEANPQAKPAPKAEPETPATASAASAAGAPAEPTAGAAAEPAATATSGSSWLAPDSPLLKPLPDSVPAEIKGFFGGVPMGALGTGALLVAGAAGLASSGGKGSSAPAAAAADTAAPALLGAKLNDSGSQLILNYNEVLSGTLPDKASFVVSVNGVANTVTAVALGSDASSVVLTLTSSVTSAQTVRVSLADGAAIKDTAGNAAASFRDQAVVVADKTAPTRLSANALTGAGGSVIVLRYSEDLLASAKPEPGDFALSVNGTPVTPSAVDVIGDSVRLTLANPIANPASATVRLNFTQPANSSRAVQDPAGNLVASISEAGGLLISSSQDLAPPTLGSAATSAELVGRPSSLLRLIFNEALDAGALPDVASLALQLSLGGSTRSVAVSSLKVVGASLELTLAETVSDEQSGLRLVYTPPASGPALQDWAGNDVAAFSRGIGLGDVVPPTVVSSRFTSATTLELTFSETLAGLGPDKASFGLVANGGAALKATGSSISGRTLVLNLDAAVESGKAATLSYTAAAGDASLLNPALQDAAGNDTASFNQTLDTTAPSLVSANTGSDGLSVRLAYNDSLLSPSSSSTPAIPAVAASAFKVFKSQGVEVVVSSVTVLNNEVSLVLASALSGTDTVTVFYVAPTANIGVANAALQDSTGNDAAALGSGVSGQPVSNKVLPTVTRAALDSLAAPLDTVTLTLSEAPVGALPDKSAFSLSLGGVAQTLGSVSLSGNDLVISLTSPLSSDGALTLSYTPPASNALQDADGNRLASLNRSLGQVKTGSAAADTLSGQAALSDYFLGSAGNDSYSGLGGADTWVWPDFGAGGPGGFVQTIKDFGFKKGSGTLQGSSEADLLDLRQLLDGYTAASTIADFLRFDKNADNKLVLNIDRDGGATFAATASLLFDNVTVDANNQLLAGGQFVSHNAGNLALVDVLAHLMAEKQLSVL